MIAAGNNAKAIATFMGHSSVQITYDRYGHLMPGGEEEAAQRLDAYLAEARAKTYERGKSSWLDKPPPSKLAAPRLGSVSREFHAVANPLIVRDLYL